MAVTVLLPVELGLAMVAAMVAAVSTAAAVPVVTAVMALMLQNMVARDSTALTAVAALAMKVIVALAGVLVYLVEEVVELDHQAMVQLELEQRAVAVAVMLLDNSLPVVFPFHMLVHRLCLVPVVRTPAQAVTVAADTGVRELFVSYGPALLANSRQLMSAHHKE